MGNPNLFVVIDPTQDEQPALARAAAMLGASGGHIRAFCCVHKGYFSPASSRQKTQHEIEQRAREKLGAMIKPVASDKVSVEAEVVWNENWFEAAEQACSRLGAELLLKSTFPHTSTSHRFSERSDYHILRHSPCPVLLSKTTSDEPYRRVLAALALEDNDRKHDALNDRVMTQAQKICRSSGASLHAVAALEGTPNIAQILKISQGEDAEKRSGEHMLSERFGVDPDKVIMDYGPAKAVIIETVEESGADLLVMGTVGRSGVSGAIIGNTCEKVLDAVPIDVLATR